MNRLAVVALITAMCPAAWAVTNIEPAAHYGYAANMGWLDWRGDNEHGAVIGECICSGFLYSPNVGWINMGQGTPTNGIRYGNLSAKDFGINHDGHGNLQGFAWGANIGWLVFTNRTATGAVFEGPTVNLLTGRLSGWIWSANAGWISLSNAVAGVATTSILPGIDSDGDGMSDAWELEKFGNLTSATATSDHDGDGTPDVSEYRAGTDPVNQDSSVQILSWTRGTNTSQMTLAWHGEPSRQYRILWASGMIPPVEWLDVGAGIVSPNSSGMITQSFSIPVQSNCYFRIEVINPLAP